MSVDPGTDNVAAIANNYGAKPSTSQYRVNRSTSESDLSSLALPLSNWT